MSATGTRRSLVFTPASLAPAPPAADVREAREADRLEAKSEAVADPQEAVLVYGHMLVDVDIIAGELRGLMFAAGEYRSRLRVVRSAAKRLEDRAARLLGEDK